MLLYLPSQSLFKNRKKEDPWTVVGWYCWNVVKLHTFKVWVNQVGVLERSRKYQNSPNSRMIDSKDNQQIALNYNKLSYAYFLWKWANIILTLPYTLLHIQLRMYQQILQQVSTNPSWLDMSYYSPPGHCSGFLPLIKLNYPTWPPITPHDHLPSNRSLRLASNLATWQTRYKQELRASNVLRLEWLEFAPHFRCFTDCFSPHGSLYPLLQGLF